MRRPITNIKKRDMTLNVAESTFEWIERACKAAGKSRSWLIEEILLDNLPEYHQNA